MVRIRERSFWILLGYLYLGACAADPGATPCVSNTNCPSTRACIDGRCRFAGSDAATLGDAGATDTGPGAAGQDAFGLDGSPDARDTGPGTRSDSAVFDAGTEPAHLDAAPLDAGCVAPCCETSVAAACAPGSVCRPDSVGAATGTCRACSTVATVSCAVFAGGAEVQTVSSECEGYAAGAETVTRGACRCGATATCVGSQICDRGVRHARDCSSATVAPEGLCIAPLSSSCDPLPRREVACDRTVFADECERLSATGMGVLARYAVDAVSCGALPRIGECYDDRDCPTGQSCYAQHDGCMAGTCQPDPSAGACYDATDCAPWQDCSATCTSSSDCARGTCFDAR